jgi:hypothetical protein
MKTEIVVANHQPIPLRPINILISELVDAKIGKAVVYLGHVTWDGATSEDRGWYIWRDGGHWSSVEGEEEFWSDMMDYDSSTDRLLQPNEVLTVRFTNG